MYLRRLIVASGGAETIVYRVTATERAVHILYRYNIIIIIIVIVSLLLLLLCLPADENTMFCCLYIIVFYYLRFRERDETRFVYP